MLLLLSFIVWCEPSLNNTNVMQWPNWWRKIKMACGQNIKFPLEISTSMGRSRIWHILSKFPLHPLNLPNFCSELNFINIDLIKGRQLEGHVIRVRSLSLLSLNF